MKLLLDTNAFFWASIGSPHLSEKAAAAILNPANDRFVSISAVWEMQIKHRIGKWALPGDVDRIAPPWLEALAADLLPIELPHLGMLYQLPLVHRDPFDRIMIGQALAEGLTIVSADPIFKHYSAPVLW